jgi:hypothetical protein
MARIELGQVTKFVCTIFPDLPISYFSPFNLVVSELETASPPFNLVSEFE